MAHEAMAPPLARLLRAVTIEDHEEILNAATAALQNSPDDISVHRTRVVALLKLDRFDDVLRGLDGAGVSVRKACAAERVYALYKSGKLEEARSSLSPTMAGYEESLAMSHLVAQVAYRTENFNEAHDIYQRLAAKPSQGSPEARDLMINRTATWAQLAWQNYGASCLTVPDKLDTFELAYNAACASIACGQLSKASTLLERATRLCDSSDLSDSEKQAEMVSIVAQQAYVYSMRGMQVEASAAYSRLSGTIDGDEEAMLLKKVNSAVLDIDETSPFLALRTVDEVLPTNKRAVPLFSYQEAKMEQIKEVLEMRAQKLSGAGSRMCKLDSTKVPQLSVVKVAAQTQLSPKSGPLGTCQRLLKSRPLDLGLVLAAIQLHLQKKNTGSAVGVLESYLRKLENEDGPQYGHIRFLPGLVALAVSLYHLHGRRQSATAELAKAAEHHAKGQGFISTSLLREAGLGLVVSPDNEDKSVAVCAFAQALRLVADDALSIAGSVAATSAAGDAVGKGFLDRLPAAEELVASTNVASLLSAGVVSGLSNAGGQAKRKDPPSQTGASAKKRRRRMPKNMDEGKRPDPERWLALRDRSSYRPKGKKGKKKANEATQGGIVKEEETLELVGGAGAVKVEKASNVSSKKKKKPRK